MINFIPKLAFFDIDGTILGSSNQLSQRVIKSIQKLSLSGTKVALATGRPSFAAKKIAQQLEIDNWSLFFSGALISRPQSEETLFEAEIDSDLIIKTIDLCKELNLYLELYTSNNYFVESYSDITPKHTHYIGFDPQLADFSDLIKSKNKIIKLLVATEGQKDRQDLLISQIPELKCLCSTGANHPDIIFNNITSITANRIDGFKRILNAYSIDPEHVISFGDASSDIDFLTLSGCGVAMKNAPKNVKEAANYVTDSVEEDGVAVFIDKILGLN